MAGEDDQQATKPKRGGGLSKLVILGLLICNLLSLGGLAAFVVMGGANESEAAPELPARPAPVKVGEPQKNAAGAGSDPGAPKGEKPEEEDGITYSASDLGPTVKLGSFVINLNDPGHPRYLKVTIKAEVTANETRGEVRARDPQVRDIVISYLSSLKIKETYGARAKATIRDNIRRRLNHILTTGEVTRIFLTDFMTQ